MYQLFESAVLGPLTLKNRTVRSATNEHLAQPNGEMTHYWVEAQEELAKGEVGLIITGHFAVEPNQRADEGQLVLDARTDLAMLAEGVEVAHRYGAKIVMQLSHTGLKAPAHVNGRPPVGPDDLSVEDMEDLVEKFRKCARMAKDAGFDGVQVHNAHGYLLSSFMNPEFNHRTDEYGGSMENRFRLTGRIIKAVREECGSDFALLTKVDCNSTDDFPGLLRLYKEAGVDGAEVSGVDMMLFPGVKKPFYLEQAVEAQKEVDLPLILVGGLFKRESIDQVLQAGIPFVSFCRALICESDFVARLKRGEDSSCFACGNCYKVYRSRPVRCVQHTKPIPQLAKVFGTELK